MGRNDQSRDVSFNLGKGITMHFLGIATTAVLLSLVLNTRSVADDIRESALSALAALEKRLGVSVTAEVEGLGTVEIQQREHEVILKRDFSVPGKAENEHAAKSRSRLQEASGSVLPLMDAFDGKKQFSYNPVRMMLTIKPAAEFSVEREISMMLPQKWTCIAGFEVLSARSIIEDRRTNLKQLNDGLWKFERVYDSPGLAFKSIEIVVDANQGFTVSSYVAEAGTLGKCSAEYSWTNDSGNWYPESAKISDYRGLKVSWKVKSIDFSLRSLPTSFAIQGKDLPFGTRIIESKGEETHESFVGGKDGEMEYRLRQRAVSRVRLKNGE